MKYTELTKCADYSDSLSHDFYDRIDLPKGTSMLKRYAAYYKNLDDVFKKIQKGKHGLAYMGRGTSETGDTTGLYVTPLDDTKPLAYADWKAQTEQALASKSLNDLENLTLPISFHVTTTSPYSTYGDNFEVPPSDEYVQSIYGASPKLKHILALVAKHRKLDQATSEVEGDLEHANAPFNLEYDQLEAEKKKALRAIDRKTQLAWNNWFEAVKAGKEDAAETKQLDRKYQLLENIAMAKAQPFDVRGEDIAARQGKALNPYYKKLDALRKRINKLYEQHI